MHAPIVVNYIPDGEDWAITVAQDQRQRTAKAAGLIAARDRADQLVAQMAPNATSRTVVHLLDGDAFAFTTSYLQARLGIQVSEPAEVDESGAEPGGVGDQRPVVGEGAPEPAEAATETGEIEATEDARSVDVHTGTLPLQAG